MTTRTSTTVAVGADGSDGAREAVRWAARLVSGRALELEVVHCLQVPALSYGSALSGSDVVVEQLDGPVVAGVDCTSNSEAAVAVAFEEASFRRVPLVAVHAWNDVTYDSTGGSARLVPHREPIEPAQERLLAQRLAGWQEKFPEVEVHRALVRDRPQHALLTESERAQLVVVGSRGRGGFAGMLLGSTSQALIQHASCPVLVVRPEAKR
ncbi:universal stress protein [Amycolatopsis sp. NPDC051903]|uniref:universal stress protein n=1 Tax=Amycolatopsis sp. NPDC051903 TaxID=3363936 RepID=UPI0037905701